MKTYTDPYDEDAPPGMAVDIRVMDTVDAFNKAQACDFTEETTGPDWRNAVSRRIVEVTDQDENIVAEFIPLDAHVFTFNHQPT